MNEHDAFKLFLEETGLSRDFIIESDFRLMLEDEAEDVIKYNKRHRRRIKYGDAVLNAVSRMINWFKTAEEYRIKLKTHEFIASHRRACCYCIFLKRHINKIRKDES
jgi:hypothetical protein